jgi:hypothetical protein
MESIMVPFLRLAAILLTVSVGATVRADNSAPAPGVVLARYSSALEQNEKFKCAPVDLEIEASLPKLEKRGRLKAIRHRAASGAPAYQVLETDGDHTVKQQVIARYLSAEAKADAMPSSSIALTAANYKFQYLGSIGNASALTYVFQITPRKRRVGLIQGELWIDSATGIPVHKAGHFVKQPSVFLRRVDIIQDTDIRDGLRFRRITRFDIETRLVGHAELTITERPCEPPAENSVTADTTEVAQSAEQTCSSAP